MIGAAVLYLSGVTLATAILACVAPGRGRHRSDY